MRAENSSREEQLFRATTKAGTPARLARSSPKASAFDDTTQTTDASSLPAAMRSSRFCNVVPPPEISTARRIGADMTALRDEKLSGHAISRRRGVVASGEASANPEGEHVLAVPP